MSKQQHFKINGIAYDVLIPKNGVKRTTNHLHTANSGRGADGKMILDLLGVYTGHTITFRQNQGNYKQYDALIKALNTPTNEGLFVSFPDGQQIVEYSAYVSKTEDTLQYISPKGVMYWSECTVIFTPLDPTQVITRSEY